MTLGALITARIGTLASSKVYCLQAPAGSVAPYIIWRPISSVPITTHDTYRSIVTALVQVDHYSTTAAASDSLRTLTIAAMCSGHDDTFCTDDGRMQLEDAVTPNLYNAQADFEITHAP
jgi:hypothetical protein